MKNLTTAIFSKCSAGTSFYTDIGGRLYKGRAPEGAAFPYAVFFVVSDVPDDTFKDNIEDVLIQFSLFSSTPSSGEIEDMFAHLKALYDDCVLTITGNTLIWMIRGVAQLLSEEETTPSGTQNVWHYTVDYSIVMEKT